MPRKAITDDMDAREIESLSMLSRGFQELRDVNPELSFNVLLDILSGLNEYVEANFFFLALLYPSCLFWLTTVWFVSYPSVTRLFGNMYKHPEDSFPTNESRERAR
jgi:hypothetical protein